VLIDSLRKLRAPFVAKPLVKIATLNPPSVGVVTADLGYRALPKPEVFQSQFADDFFELWPWVRYVCDPALELLFVSQNIAELIGVRPENLIGSRAIWSKMILQEDSDLVSNKLKELKRAGTISFTHRITDGHGLPVWVFHSARQMLSQGVECFHGCIMPMRAQGNAAFLAPKAIIRFVHKLGNHFQLLNLVVSSLRKSLPESQEIHALEETVERAVELMRAFSEYSQNPTWVSTVELAEIIEAAAITRSSLFVQKGIRLKRTIAPSLRGLTMEGDPYLLELAIGEVIQNALEATDTDGEVILNARVECFDGKPCAFKVSVSDDGCGIEPSDLGKVTSPFYTAKPSHDGLGLSMAARFVELHGGILKVVSRLHEGTEVQITLPVHDRLDNSCR